MVMLESEEDQVAQISERNQQEYENYLRSSKVSSIGLSLANHRIYESPDKSKPSNPGDSSCKERDSFLLVNIQSNV